MTEANKTIKSDETLLGLLEVIYDRDGATLTELSEQSNRSKSTVHRHLATLHQEGFIVKEDSEYHLGLQFLRLGTAARRRTPYHRHIAASVQQLAEQTGEFVAFLKEEQGVGTFIYCEIGADGVSSQARVGQTVHLHQTASGRAILASYSDDRVRSILSETGLPASTPETITDRNHLFDQLEQIRECGYATVRDEYVDGLWAVAVSVSGPDGDVLGSIVVAGPTHRMAGEINTTLPDTLEGARKELELNLEYA